MARGLASLDGRIGPTPVDGGLVAFETAFPSLPVYRDELRADDWLARPKGAIPGREAALEELGAEIGHGGHGQMVVKLKGRTHGFHDTRHSLSKEEVSALRKFLVDAGVDPARDFPL